MTAYAVPYSTTLLHLAPAMFLAVVVPVAAVMAFHAIERVLMTAPWYNREASPLLTAIALGLVVLGFFVISALLGTANAADRCNYVYDNNSRLTCAGPSDRATPAQTWSHRGRRVAPHAVDANGNPSMATVRVSTGSHGMVAHQFRAAMQGILSDIEAMGFKIKYIGCWRAGWGVAGAHPQGRACDACQWSRNKTTGKKGCSLPSDARLNAIARAHGCVHGAEWSWPDRGHFECGRTDTAKRHHPFLTGEYLARRHHKAHYARAP